MDVARALIAGIVATAIMTMLMFTGPLLGLPAISVGGLIASTFSVAPITGWTIHFLFGALLGVLYAMIVGALPGSPFFRGLLFGGLTFLGAQIVAMPLLGFGAFMGGVLPLLVASLFVHLVFGAVLGVLYGDPGTHLTSAYGAR